MVCGNRQNKLARGAEAEATREARYTPRFDIVETVDEVTLYGDLPGAKPEDVDVRYDRGELTVFAKVAPRQVEGKYLRREYGVGDFQRVFQIGEGVNPEGVTAELKNGVLVIHAPKAAAVKARKVPVRT